MELKIDELISNINDNQVAIATINSVSVKRIRDLALEKINSAQSHSAAHRHSLSIGILVAILVISLSAIATASTQPYTQPYTLHTTDCIYYVTDDGQLIPPPAPDWGVTFSVSNVTPTGMVLTCTQADGDYSGQLATNVGYYLERQTDSGWEIVSKTNDEYVFQGAGIEISRDSVHSWTIDWSNIYGELSPGTYKLNKPVWERKDRQTIRVYHYSIEFVIGGDA